VQNNGDTYTQNALFGVPPLAYKYYGTKFDTFSLNVGWGFDSRNRALFADRGARHRLNLSYAVPGSDVEFYTLNYDYLQFLPINKWFTVLFNADLGYGFDLGDTTEIRRTAASTQAARTACVASGRAGSARRTRSATLTAATCASPSQLELLLPMPEKFRNSARFSLFIDAGNVFSTDTTTYVGRDGITPVEYDFDPNEIKYSTGVAVQWLAPLGVFRFSYAFPLNADENDGVEYGDETEGFQFSIDRHSEVSRSMRIKIVTLALLASAAVALPSGRPRRRPRSAS